ncbi:hypothetical protein NIES2135_09620 [Leptolyngbya boryana NIES-2135]|jgi:hypothetical protein|uniref:Uncharacterized protein n=1 Tax=Leptolyngbya boryana NIES-2135 TaxID=1973484 RepID=A0A1Z4JBU9_LEPBY|nr:MULTISPECIES: hypothetical protein [Leptolyngbya]BAY54148.1 hypothetical protein NIES2135_09620 [Leptolyngbya boryana NIES-2135]MBD2371018.1 hypothetical protein [Leptolyngbya sp. FACHB-161]MBD2377524.1 hypothetical protein [Leptolyngbya sp. FACHB-238]MBD2401932.1 hypothetical protein [Leptolyngbya sp. FACHB-239]MBD2408450.1 hypothetical protein [Leptolyngbya sp. FACHB-402]
MATIQFAIEGQDAVLAAQELVSLDGIQGSWTTDDTARKEGTIAVIASVIAIVGGTVAIAEQIRKWYKEYKQGKSGTTIDKVVIVCGSQRLLLENASAEQIQKVLESCLNQ